MPKIPPPRPKLSPFQQHVADWSNCTRCPLCETRKNVVLLRGTVPCDVLFIGEAPGESEDVIGRPFKGPAGHLMDVMVAIAIGDLNVSYAFTNLVGCIPRNDEGAKAGQPDEEAIKACAPRLYQITKICRPKLIVTVGKLSRTHALPSPVEAGLDYQLRFIDIDHPAYILRAPLAQQGLLKQRAIVTIRESVEEILSA